MEFTTCDIELIGATRESADIICRRPVTHIATLRVRYC